MQSAGKSDGRLLQLLREELSGPEQEMFVNSFHMYLNHNAKKEFVVDLDDVYDWLGFSTKGNAKRVLDKQLVDGQHFKTLRIQADKQTGEAQGRGGTNKERVLMTVNGFKQFCMAANTDKAKLIREYYITMEGILLEHTREVMDETRTLASSTHLALEAAQTALDSEREATAKAQADAATATAALERYRSKTYEEVPKMDHVYINKELTEASNDIHKIGKSIDPKKRLAQFRTASARGIVEVYQRATHNAPIVEKIVEVAMKRYHYASLGGEEHYNCDVEHSINIIDVASTVVDTLAGCYEYISREELVQTVLRRLEDLLVDLPEATPPIHPAAAVTDEPPQEDVVKTWLHQIVQFTGAKVDRVAFDRGLVTKLAEQLFQQENLQVAPRDLALLIKAFFVGRGCWKAQENIKQPDNSFRSFKNVATGVRLL